MKYVQIQNFSLIRTTHQNKNILNFRSVNINVLFKKVSHFLTKIYGLFNEIFIRIDNGML